MSVRSLSNVLQKKAEQELNELPQEIDQHLIYIRDWLKNQPHLNVRDEDQWLLAFLRGCKYSYERTKNNIDYFHTMRSMLPEFFADRNMHAPTIQEILKAHIFAVLPETSTPDGPRIFFIRLTNYDADKISVEDLFKVYFMCMDVLMHEDDVSVVAGITVITDCKDVKLKTISQCTPTLLKKIVMCLQGKYPLRLKGCYYINAPVVLETIYNTSKTFMNEKLKKRIFVEKDARSLFKVVPISVLPAEYGGEAGTVSELGEKWNKKLELYREWFLEDDQYKSVESLRVGTVRTYEEVFGMEGSFKKLDID